MTFFIPPVFLFGNNANRFHNNEEKKSEYKTAAETEIKVENWREKRIAELEQENKELKKEREMFIEDLSSDKELYQQIVQKQRDYYEENKKLNTIIENTKIEQEADRKHIEQLEEENRKLKEAAKLYREDNKRLRIENEYLHKLLPEADGYIIEKQLEQRLWNDGEEDVYEDWGE